MHSDRDSQPETLPEPTRRRLLKLAAYAPPPAILGVMLSSNRFAEALTILPAGTTLPATTVPPSGTNCTTYMNSPCGGTVPAGCTCTFKRSTGQWQC